MICIRFRPRGELVTGDPRGCSKTSYILYNASTRLNSLGSVSPDTCILDSILDKIQDLQPRLMQTLEHTLHTTHYKEHTKY